MLFRLGKKHTNKQNNKTENKKANLIVSNSETKKFYTKTSAPKRIE